MRAAVRSILVTTLVAPLSLLCYGQNRSALLMGTIYDPLGAVIPGAKVTVLNVETGIKRTVVTGPSGRYVVPLLEPGNHRILVRKEGFRSLSRSGIVLHVNESVEVDLVLELGAVTESVTVQLPPPLLETGEASQSLVIDNTQVLNLPLNGRNAYQLSALTPGVIPGGGFEDSVTINRMNNINVNGGASFNNEVLLDGVSNVIAGHGQIAVAPSVDAVQEFRVQTTQYSAEFGRTSGGVVNLATKSGTNEFHGTLYHFLRNKVLKANNFFNNRAGVDRAPFVYNQFGGTIGGPILKNRTFFFFGYEGYRIREAKNFTGTVPTAAMREGDFSGLMTPDGKPVTIYDPFTSRPVSKKKWIRDPFPGNVIPASMFDPVAVNVTPMYPLPNKPGLGSSVSQNFIANASSVDDLNMFTGRFDHSFSEANRLFFRASRNSRQRVPPNFFGTPATSNSFGPSDGVDWHAVLNDTHAFSPATVLEIRLGYALNAEDRLPETYGLDLTTLGFPEAFNARVQAHYFPTFSVQGYSTLGASAFTVFSQGSQTRSLAGSLTHIRGRHTLKFGGEVRILNHNSRLAPEASGRFWAQRKMTQGPNPDKASKTAGDGYASLLLGTLNRARARLTADISYRTIYYAGYIQDDIKATSKLTLNIGLRYSYETPRTERWNRLTWFDPEVLNPVGEDIGWEGPPLRGGLRFAGVDGPRGWADPDRNNFAPRFGFAYRALTRTVIRGGYGISYLPNGTSYNGFGAGQEGFTTRTTEVVTIDGRTPETLLHEAFSDGLIEPSGASLGLYTLLGSSVSANLRNIRVGYSQQWSLTIQQELPGGWLLEAGYVGSRGIKIPISFTMNQLREEQLQLGEALLEKVPNPFFGHWAVTGGLAKSKVQRRQLLRPYPHFSGVTFPSREAGASTFHSFQARVERRFANGFSLLAAYTNSKLISDTDSRKAWVGGGELTAGPQNAYNLRAERSIAPQDVSQRLVTSFLYELPFGRGKRWGSGWSGVVNALLGGWQVNGIVTFSTGRVLRVTAPNESFSYNGSLRPNSTGESAELPASERSIDRWFRTDVFEQPPPFTFGNVSRTLPDVREHGIKNFNLSAMKNTRLTERFTLQFRAEFFNAFNTPRWGRPDGALLSNTFGVITSQLNAPREIQFGLKLVF